MFEWLKTILGDSYTEEIDKKVAEQIGKDFISRADFNTKNAEVEKLNKQIADLQTNIDATTQKTAEYDNTIAELTGKVSKYEIAALKSKIAYEKGIPYELAGRLSGDDEDAITADAESLSKLIKTRNAPPLKSTERGGSEENDAYKSLLSKIKGE